MNLPEHFQSRVQSQLSDFQVFFDCLEGASPVSIRLNPGKREQANILPQGTPVLWNADGIYLSERLAYGSDPSFHAGLYYPMEASSMFLKWALDQIHPEEDDLMLDLCAAPGGKTLILKDVFPDHVLVSNEIEPKRAHILKENAIRWGTEKHIVINSGAEKLQRSDLQFDLVLVDAPCSGEGLFRKDKQSRGEWTAERAAGCAIRQTKILEDVLHLLAPGGTLIYSTCTYNPAENAGQVERLTHSEQLETQKLMLQESWQIEELTSNGTTSYQFWPHRTNGEGFFISILRDTRKKEGQWFETKKTKPTPFNYLKELDLSDLLIQKFDTRFFGLSEAELSLIGSLAKAGKVLKRGVFLGEEKGKDFIPSYDLAMNPRSLDYQKKLELDLDQSMQYLQGNPLRLDADKGPVLLTHDVLPLGFGKSNGQRINNLYPKHLRIK